ncbi:MAG: hypothetical protein KC912_23130 [Proteobacteria bacterium]|nr:hypothetical protein [Pseudomonadota bacterium]
MLRHRQESNLEIIFFGGLFSAAVMMLGHGIGQAIVFPMMARSEAVASIANGFAQIWIG